MFNLIKFFKILKMSLKEKFHPPLYLYEMTKKLSSLMSRETNLKENYVVNLCIEKINKKILCSLSNLVSIVHVNKRKKKTHQTIMFFLSKNPMSQLKKIKIINTNISKIKLKTKR